MKEYKLVYLNKGVKLSREKDLQQAEEMINKYVSDGWTLQEIATPDDGVGAMIGVFYKEDRLRNLESFKVRLRIPAII